MFAKFACLPENSRGRIYKELPTPYRNEYQRDRDRIIHSNAFRRLQYKTQVFINHEGDHFRNRLTHSIEASTIARSLARALGLSEDLSESITLAHDLGHTPFGHAGEDALDAATKNYGGFCHNTHAIKLLTFLEKRYASYNGLNLTWEVIEGIAKHNGPIKGELRDYLAKYNVVNDLELDKYSSAESQVASLSDDIAYNCHDLEDGIMAGLYSIEELEEFEFMRKIVHEISDRFKNVDRSRKVYEISRELAHLLINDLLYQTRKNIIDFNIETETDVRELRKPLVSFSEEMFQNLKQIKLFLTKKVYLHHNVVALRYKCKNVIKVLFSLYFDLPECMPREWYERSLGGDNIKAEVISDYIAGMTDRFAIKEFNSLTNFHGSPLI